MGLTTTRTRPASAPAPSPTAAPAPAARTRVSYFTRIYHGYDEVLAEGFTPDPDGEYLTSRSQTGPSDTGSDTGSGTRELHLPIFDVDVPVTVTSTFPGHGTPETRPHGLLGRARRTQLPSWRPEQASDPVTRIRLHGDIRVARLTRIVKALVRAGFADPAWAGPYVHSLQVSRTGHGPWARIRSQAMEHLPLVLTVPVVAVPSRTAGHSHLYIEQAMPFADSLRLARALGVVDPKHIRVSRQTGEWIVRTP